MIKNTLLVIFQLFFAFFIPMVLQAQQYHDFGFVRNDTVVVQKSDGSPYTFPWAGGINSCQLGNIHLDDDTLNDLLAFDRNGNRILPFVNKGTQGVPLYSFAPGYIKYFPELKEWVLLRDFNCDGKADIFTYTTGGIKVFRNISDSVPRFRLETPLLLSYQYGGYVNLLVTLADYPVIDDLDGDGDLDILTFFGLGSYVELHKNISMEKYGNCDSLDFVLDEKCWGFFREGTESNILTLNVPCPYNQDTRPAIPLLHTGSTLLTLDLNDDGLKDLLIGDVGYPQLIALQNGGTTDSALITAQDTAFPAPAAVHLISFPAASYLDINNDNVNDLFVSPFDPTFDNAENKKSCWLYYNYGSNTLPKFYLSGKNFLQKDMIDAGAGAYPVFEDIDADGLTDVVIGNYGTLDSSWMLHGSLFTRYHAQLAFYKNTGSEKLPVYKLITEDLGNISSLKIRAAYPAFADLDGDGKSDLLLGNASGNVIFFKNTGIQNGLPQYEIADMFFAGIDVGGYSAPQFFDLNGDGLNDLVIGKQDGTISFYQNTGTQAQPYFTFVTDNLGNVDVTDTLLSYDGFSTPCFFHDKKGKMCLFCGSEFGNIFYYNNISNNLSGTFTLVENPLLFINNGSRNAVTVKDLNGDGYPEMIAGNYSGGVTFYQGVSSSEMDVDEKPGIAERFFVYPNPANQIIFIKNSFDANSSPYKISIFDLTGRIIKRSIICNGESLDVSTLHAGVYFCRIGLIVKKIMICH
ncbi:MAG: T9SS type A sorting domain-containing protein [Lentimicrobiaceae bacterium]|nr:T9SS type A sorting domain-containing protein [Lentimicrobiaceae bacterium]